MIEEYLNTWKTIFKIAEPLSRKNFWIFLVFNYIFFMIVTSIVEFLQLYSLSIAFSWLTIVFSLSTILAIIKILNNKQMPLAENDKANSLPIMDFKFFMKLLLASIMIGVVNGLLILILDSNSMNLIYILFFYCISLIPISFIVFLIIALRSNKEMTNMSLVNYYLIVLGISCFVNLLLNMVGSK
ncbi:hypothetical protein FFWV33_04100 [Flavobacterium faecale]|uniref:Uncharacterized protein n=1 Tax=Flavobacterium faecale TaxID=1355330 RepID=A0A2S1LAR2_9FLAO|nr:hypothetical protein [Flavobacterium faecale]AWG20778.1 hypothetical protein FFWV33_04100 [Flavobacterium faecale]